jgi:hypothetical protein
VLRRVSGQELRAPLWAEGRIYNVVGDCYLDGVGGVGDHADNPDTEEGGEVDEDGNRWPGGLPWELLFWHGSGPTMVGKNSLLVQTGGERVFLV